MLKHANSAARIALSVAALSFVVALGACSDAPPPPTVTKTVTSRTTTAPVYGAPTAGTTTTTTQTNQTNTNGTAY
jgi:hypothetical protein